MFRTRMFWFVLVGENGEIIATGETVSQKHNVTEVLNKYFPDYPVFDTTVKGTENYVDPFPSKNQFY